MVYRVQHPDDAGWESEHELLAHISDLLAIGNWQRIGKKTAKKPEPLKRPGRKRADNGKTFGGAPSTIAEIDAWLAGDGITVKATDISSV